MEPDAVTGALAPVRGSLSKHMACMREIHDHPEMPTYDLIEYDPLVDSADLSPDDWLKIAEDIEANYFEYDGFLVITGTDTMAYVASALSFMLENLAKPVVITGSQIPFCEVYNDARRNLIISMIFASREDFLEVCIFFHDRLLRGNRSVKVNSFTVDAFDSPNFPRLAQVGVNITTRQDLSLRVPKGRFKVHRSMNKEILVLRLVPGFDDQSILDICMKATNLRALVLEIYGTGNAPAKKNMLLQAIGHARDRGIVVVACTQCFTGGVVLEKYAVGTALAEAGVVGGGDMTTEACVTKLAYLLNRTDISLREVEELMVTDLRGELSHDLTYRSNIFTPQSRL